MQTNDSDFLQLMCSFAMLQTCKQHGVFNDTTSQIDEMIEQVNNEENQETSVRS